MIRTIRAVLFDFDGTLTEPGDLDFDRFRKQIGCPSGTPVLEFLVGIPEPRRSAVERELDEFETEAAQRARVNPGAEDLIRFLRRVDIPCAILSRNSRRSVDAALSLLPFPPDTFRLILTRDDRIPLKPDPDSVRTAAARLGLEPSELLCVGDFVFDIRAGRGAGAPTVLLTNGRTAPDWAEEADLVVASLAELRGVIELHRPLAPGKLPNSLLGPMLSEFRKATSGLLFGPGVGRDAAVVQGPTVDSVVVLKSDPVTFTSQLAAHYAVAVNCNDIAAAGGTPRWLLASLLLPIGTTAAAVEVLLTELGAACRRFGVVLCGGHTEVTDAVTRPVISAHAVGFARSEEWVGRDEVREGDRIIVTKWAGLEGTSILAREFPASLLAAGLSEKQMERSRNLIFDPGIGIVEEARVALRSPGLTALHDVTEGGIATALRELAQDCGCRFRVDPARIPVLPETQHICRQLGIDPLGLIGSGSLLILVRPTSAGALVRVIEEAGIPAAEIGRVEAGTGLVDGDGEEWKEFDVDELARVYPKLAE
jgi:hydrogenase expression/formation protein HypE